METSVIHTNNRIKSKRMFQIFSKTLFTFKCNTDEIEIRAFIGLVYLRGLLGRNYLNTEVLYNPTMGPQPFGATTSKNSLEFYITVFRLMISIPDHSDCLTTDFQLFVIYLKSFVKIVFHK